MFTKYAGNNFASLSLRLYQTLIFNKGKKNVFLEMRILISVKLDKYMILI